METGRVSLLYRLRCCDTLQVNADKGCVIVAQMSSDGCLANDDYTQRESATHTYVALRRICYLQYGRTL